ncbi:T9SS type A sorting domain-containing protein [Schleiferia thermophila]|jgi:hypothetical protein|nr:T9SS type A sorting domain-containing protein [Schleiferia thermophila]
MIPGLMTLSPTWLNAQFSLQPSSVGSNAVGICGSTATFQVIGHNPTFSVTGFFPVGFTATQSFNSSTGVLTLSSVNITDFKDFGTFNITYTNGFNVFTLSSTVVNCCINGVGNEIFVQEPTSPKIGGGFFSFMIFDVYGTVHLDENYTFDNCIFNLAPDAQLVIDASYTVEFTNCSIVNCNNEYRWDAIVVDDPSSTLSITQTHTEAGIRGVWALNNPTVLIDNSTFSNNMISLLIENFTAGSNNVVFTENTVDIWQEGHNGILQSPSSTVNLMPYTYIADFYHQAIVLINSYEVYIGDQSAGINNLIVQGNTENPIVYSINSQLYMENNRLENGPYGIVGKDSYLNIGNSSTAFNEFINNNTAIQSLNGIHDILYNTFNNGSYAIKLDLINQSGNNNVSHNQIHNYTTGIYLGTPKTLYNRTLIHSNILTDIEARGIDIARHLSDPNWTINKRLYINFNEITGKLAGNTFRGISLDNCENAVVGENYITHANTAMSSNCDIWTIYGLYTNNSLNTWIGNNIFENLCYSIFGIDNLLFTRIECNQFINTRGIYFQNVNIGNIGSPAQSANNEWVMHSYPFKLEGTLNVGFPITYYWNSSQGLTFNPNTWAGSLNPDFTDNSSATISSCNSVPSNRGLTIDELPAIATNLYPNPTSNLLNIQLSKKTYHHDIMIINQIGQKVYSYKVTEFTDQLQINLENLASGMYIMQINSDAGQSRHRIVKN